MPHLLCHVRDCHGVTRLCGSLHDSTSSRSLIRVYSIKFLPNDNLRNSIHENKFTGRLSRPSNSCCVITANYYRPRADGKRPLRALRTVRCRSYHSTFTNPILKHEKLEGEQILGRTRGGLCDGESRKRVGRQIGSGSSFRGSGAARNDIAMFWLIT